MKKNFILILVGLILSVTSVFADPAQDAKAIHDVSELFKNLSENTRTSHESLVTQINTLQAQNKEKKMEVSQITQILQEGQSATAALLALKEQLNQVVETEALKQASEATKSYFGDSKQLIQSDMDIVRLVQKDVETREKFADVITYNEKGELIAPNEEIYKLYSEMQTSFKRIRKQQIKYVHLLRVDRRRFSAAIKLAHQNLNRQMLGDVALKSN
jgi:rubrerythrin